MNDKVKIWMNSAMHYMMLSCDTATFLITKRDYQKLRCKENLQLKMHLMGCKLCRSFNAQSSFLSEKIQMIRQELPLVQLSSQKKAEIEQALKAQN
jgi:anaerobic C4-dicarboxylate transporter